MRSFSGQHQRHSAAELEYQSAGHRTYSSIDGAPGDTGSLKIIFDDDMPSLVKVTTPTMPVLVTDDSDTPNDVASGLSFAGLFSKAAGADGYNGGSESTGVDYKLLLNGFVADTTFPDSGLDDSLTGQSVLLRMNAAGTVIEGFVQGSPSLVAFTITLDPDTGTISMEQDRAIKHDQPGSTDPLHEERNSEGNADGLAADLISLKATIEDADHDTATDTIDITAAFRFEDDGPTMAIEEFDSLAPLTTDDDDLGVSGSDTVNYGALFSATSGADGFKGGSEASGVVFTLSITGFVADTTFPDSGLDDVATGKDVLLRLNGSGQVEGFIDNGDTTTTVVFTVAVDNTAGPTRGDVTLTQLRAIEHNNAGDPNEVGSEAETVTGNLIKLTATVTDGDNDTASQTLDISSALRFTDSGPTVTATGTAPTLVLDESAAGTDPDGPGDAPAGTSSATSSASFGTLFSSVNYGADGAGSVGYALELSADGIGSGLFKLDASGPQGKGGEILLAKVGSNIVGYVGSTANVYFTISVNNTSASADFGKVTFSQSQNVWHPTTTSDDDDATLTLDGVGEYLRLRQTVTDKDNDSASATVDLSGKFVIEDDGPRAVDDTDSIPAGTNGPATGNVITGIDIAGGDDNTSDGEDDASGTDQGLRVTFIDNDATDPSDPSATDASPAKAVPSGGSITIDGQYGVLTIWSNGDYSYARNPGQGGGETERFYYTVTDTDGDSDVAELAILINDATPEADTVTVLLDDDVLANGNLDGPADDNPDSATFPITSALLGTGGDPDLRFELTASVVETGGASGLTYELTDPTAATQQLLVKQGSETIVKIVLTKATGAIAVTQENNLLHSDDAANEENNQILEITYKVIDSDGDEAAPPGVLKIDIDDDSPTVSVIGTAPVPALEVDETDLLANDGPVSFAGLFDADYGADGQHATTPLTWTLDTAGGDSGLVDTATGDAVLLKMDGGAVKGYVTIASIETTVFLITVNGSGEISLDQQRAIVHPNPNDTNEAKSLAASLVSLELTVMDADGDTVSTSKDIGNAFTFRDDAPTVTATGTAPTLVLDESAAGTDPDGPGDAPAGTSSATSSASFGTLFSAVNYGADGAGSVGYTLELSADGIGSGLFKLDASGPQGKGGEILLAKVGSNIVGYVGSTANVYFTISVNNTSASADFGKVTFSQAQNVWHPTTTSDDDDATLMLDGVGEYLRLRQTVTDKDNDSASATVDLSGKFVIEDDGPDAGTNAKVYLDDETAATPYDTPNLGGTGDYDGSTPLPATTGTLAHDYGTDGAGTLLLTGAGYATYTGGPVGAEKSFAQELTNGGKTLTIWQVQDSAWVAVVKVELSNDTAGAYTVTQMKPVFHGTDSTTEEEQAFSVAYRVTDRDGDYTDGSLSIDVDDDTPIFTGNVQDQTVDSDPLDAANSIATGTLHFSPGADGSGPVGTISLVSPADLTSNNNPVSTYQIGNVLYGYVEAGTADGGIYTEGQDTKVFTLTINPDAGTSGQYVFDLIGHIDGQIVPAPIGSATSFGAGPSAAYILYSDTSAVLSVVSGWSNNGTTSVGVNGATPGWGVNPSANLDQGEMLRFDFGGGASDWDGAGGYTAPAVTLPSVTYATFNLNNFQSDDTVIFTVHYVGGGSDTTTYDGNNAAYPVNAPDGKYIDYIEVYISEAGASGKVGLTSVGIRAEEVDTTLSFQATLSDSDGDTVQSDEFSVRVVDGGTPNVVAPIALDLGGDGVEYLSRDDGVTYDYGFGRVATGWVGAHDGLLARQTAGGLDIVFADDAANARTDLEGLALAHDSNADGVFDASDADFAQFGVWQDADSDGTVDVGEFRTLTQAGIAAIQLTSDGKAGVAANGDVLVHGEGTYLKADGSTGKLADVSFMVSAERSNARSIEFASVAVAASALSALTAPYLLVSESRVAPDGKVDATLTYSHDAPALDVSHHEDVSPNQEALPSSVAPQGDSHAGPAPDSDDQGDATLPPDSGQGDQAVQDSGSGGDSDPAFAAHVPIVASFDADGEAMLALLAMQTAPAQDPQAGLDADLGAIRDAIADADQHGLADQLVANLTPDAGDGGSVPSSGDLAHLLAISVSDTDAGGVPMFDFNQQVADEAHVLAVAG